MLYLYFVFIANKISIYYEVFPICFRYIYEPWKRNFAIVGIHKYVQQVILSYSVRHLLHAFYMSE